MYKINFCYFQVIERQNGWINVGDLQGAVHFKIGGYLQSAYLYICISFKDVKLVWFYYDIIH